MKVFRVSGFTPGVDLTQCIFLGFASLHPASRQPFPDTCPLRRACVTKRFGKISTFFCQISRRNQK